MATNLHPSFEKIMSRDAQRAESSWGQVVPHYVMFGTATSDIMDIKSSGPIYLPSAGDQIELHGVRVQVVSITTDYQLNDDNEHVVYTNVYIEPVDSE